MVKEQKEITATDPLPISPAQSPLKWVVWLTS
jgi:hypothetical protein